MSIFQHLFGEKERKPDKVTEDGIRIYVSDNGSFEVDADNLMKSKKVQEDLKQWEKVFNRTHPKVVE